MSALVLGALNGLTIGLLAIGIVLVYKANRFINLAHGQLGALSAALLAKFVVDLGWSWQVGFPLAIGTGVVLGVVVERVFIRPMRARTSSGTRLLLLTIGVAQVLLALTYVSAFRPNGLRLQREGYPVPLDSQVEVAGVILDGPSLLILLLVPVVIVTLGAFLRFSMLGKTMRAAAGNPDAARLCGISVVGVGVISWAIAGGLSALAAVLQAPSQPTFDAEALGPGLLLRALGAAAFGGFVRLPSALVGAMVIGVAEHTALHVTHDASTAELVVFLVIVTIMFARGGVIAAATGSHTSGLDARRPTTVPLAVRDRPLVAHHRLFLGSVALAIGLLVPLLPYFRPEDRRFLLALVLVHAIVGVALTVVVGWSGQVSLGHFALVGVGAFMTAELVPHGWSLPLVLGFAGGVGAVLMVLVGLPALRLRGLTLAVTTLGFAVIGPSWLFRQEWFGSPQQGGIVLGASPLPSGLGALDSQLEVYYAALAVLAVTVLSLGALRRSVPGRLVLAVRDNEDAAASFGVTPATVKLATLAVSGFVAAMSGVLWASAWLTVGAAHFAPQLSLAILAVPVIGGLGSLSGAVAGAVALYVPTYFLSGPFSSLFGDFGEQVGFQLAFGGLGLVGVLLRYPSGLAGAGQRAWESFLRRVDSSVAQREQGEGHDVPLAVAGVGLQFGGVRALDDVSITVGPGEIVGLIGPNGAGKTTLLNAISGVLHPRCGSIRTFGEELVGLDPEYRAHHGLGRGFQSAHLFPGLTVTEAVQVALSRSGRVGVLSSMVGAPWGRALERRTEARARELIERFGLTPWADALTGELSTGTRRICDLACQVAAEPKVLLLDEPDRRSRPARRRGVRPAPAAGARRAGLLDPDRRARHAVADGGLRPDLRHGDRAGHRRGHPRGDPQRPSRRGELPRHRRRCHRPFGAGAARGQSERKASAAPAASARSDAGGGGVMGEHPLLSARGIEFAYGQVPVLFGVSLDAAPGEAVALLGTNGAGKSTLLRVIAGLERPAAGSITFAGDDITGQPAERLVSRGLVLVPGGRGVFADMTVAENLEVQSLLIRRKPGLRRARQGGVLESFPRLGERMSVLAGSLSGGEQQQLALAKALLLEPTLLCIDELSLGLSPAIVQELLEIVRRINASGVAVVLVEQSLNIAASLCDRAVFLEKGEVRFEGRTSELLERDDVARAVFLGAGAV